MKEMCEIIRDLLPLYWDKVCSEESKRMVEEHLQDCQACRKELQLMQDEVDGVELQKKEWNLAEAAAAAWRRGKKTAFIRGGLAALLAVLVLAGAYVAIHWFSTVAAGDRDALAGQAAEYLGYDRLSILEVEKRGDYLAALCTDEGGNLSMCVFDRDDLFGDRWYANGGKKSLQSGEIGSWNFGSPEGEAVLIFCGGDIPKEVCWYRFENGGITYTCPVEDGTVLDVFVIPDRTSINGYAVPLDREQQALE